MNWGLLYVNSSPISDEERDRNALLADNARKLAEICALKERLAALEPPVVKVEFPVRALRHKHQTVGLVSQWRSY